MCVWLSFNEVDMLVTDTDEWLCVLSAPDSNDETETHILFTGNVKRTGGPNLTMHNDNLKFNSCCPPFLPKRNATDGPYILALSLQPIRFPGVWFE